MGFDVNPLAVDFCYANSMLAISKSNTVARATSYELCIHLSDAVVDPIGDVVGPLFGGAVRAEKKVLGVNFVDGAATERGYGGHAPI